MIPGIVPGGKPLNVVVGETSITRRGVKLGYRPQAGSRDASLCPPRGDWSSGLSLMFKLNLLDQLASMVAGDSPLTWTGLKQLHVLCEYG
jgi:hypothetical protein